MPQTETVIRQALKEKVGVCRDFAHTAIALCRCLNIPARYCTGYISDVGQPPPYAPMDFAAWMEVWLGDRWWVFDPRNNDIRRGRVLIARGRDAADPSEEAAAKMAQLGVRNSAGSRPSSQSIPCPARTAYRGADANK